MAKRVDFDGVAQGDVLIRYRQLAGLSRTQVAVQINMEADTYRKYETGQTELRISQVAPFARALKMTPYALAEALGLTEDDELAPANWFRNELAGLRAELDLTDGEIDALTEEWEGRPWTNQRAAIIGLRSLAALERRSASA